MGSSKYETHVKPKLDLISAWARDGLIEEEIVKRLGVAHSSLSSYKKMYPELLEALKKGKEDADYKVEDSLYSRTQGIEYYEEVEELRQDRKTGEVKYVVVKRTKKFIPPDPTSCFFWLKNRKAKQWSDRKDVNVSGSVKLEEFFKE